MPSEQVLALLPLPDGVEADLVVHPADTSGPIPCRGFTYRLHQGGSGFVVTGSRCRQGPRNWVGDLANDHVAPAFSPPPIMAAAPPAPDQASAAPPPPDLQVRALQDNLRRLAYYDGPLDGTVTPRLRAAISSFEQDEGVSGGGEADSRAQSLALSAIGRIPVSGNCPSPAPAGFAIACGHVR